MGSFARFTRGLAWACLMAASAAMADSEHYNNMLIGDRAFGMGGAYTAVSDDPSGLYYNPAGIAYAAAPNLSASVNAFTSTRRRYKNVLAGSVDWTRDSTSLLPNFFGVIQPFGNGVAGFSYAVSDSVNENQDEVFTDIPVSGDVFISNLNYRDNTYLIGPSYARRLGDSLSVGITGYFHYRSRELIQNQRTEGSTPSWINQYSETTEYGLRPVVGLMWAPTDKWALGVSAATTMLLSSSTQQQSISSAAANATVQVFDNEREYPWQVNIGLAYFASDRLMFSADLQLFTATTDSFFGDRETTWNVALGMERYFTPMHVMRLGFFTNNANTPELRTGSTNQLEHLDYYGVSGSFTRFTRNSSLSIGLSFSAGEGDVQLFAAPNTSIQQVESYAYTIFLATSYSY